MSDGKTLLCALILSETEQAKISCIRGVQAWGVSGANPSGADLPENLKFLVDFLMEKRKI